MSGRLGRSLAALALAGVLGATAAEATAKPQPAPSRLLVTAREFSLSLSRAKLKPGPAIVQLYDYGEDPHNLLLQKIGGPTVFTTDVVEPGETGEVRLRLRKRSRYTLWCSLADHAERGMTAELRVGARKKRRR